MTSRSTWRSSIWLKVSHNSISSFPRKTALSHFFKKKFRKKSFIFYSSFLQIHFKLDLLLFKCKWDRWIETKRERLKVDWNRKWKNLILKIFWRVQFFFSSLLSSFSFLHLNFSLVLSVLLAFSLYSYCSSTLSFLIYTTFSLSPSSFYLSLLLFTFLPNLSLFFLKTHSFCFSVSFLLNHSLPLLTLHLQTNRSWWWKWFPKGLNPIWA